MIRRRTSEKGNAIAMVLIIIMLIAGMGAALATVTSVHNRTSSTFHISVETSYAAEAGLEQGKMWVATSLYDVNGNVWLNTYKNVDDLDNIYPSPTDVPVPSSVMDPAVPPSSPWVIGRATVTFYVYSLDTDGKVYRLVSRAVLGNRSVTLAQDIRARDSFARFATFVDQGDLTFAASTVAGDVHSNDNIWFYGPGGTFLGNVTAAGSFNMAAGADMTNTSFASYATGVPKITMPTVASVDSLRVNASGVYDIHQSNPLYSSANPVNAEILLMGNLIQITVKDSVSGTVLNPGALPVPMPANGVIYVQGNVTSIKGTANGQVTIATPGTIDVTGRLTYVDALGNPAYSLLKSGVPVPGNDTPAGVVWDSTYTYVPNPAFVPGPKPPVVGLMAGGDIEITPAADYNMEVHAALLSTSSNWYANSDPGNVKGNFRFVGSMTSSTPGYRASPTDGYVLSGEYQYDANLTANPPPSWLTVDRAYWGPRRRVGVS